LKKHIWLKHHKYGFLFKKERKRKSSSAFQKVLIPVLDKKTEEQISAVADLSSRK
jgi:hypothetical protein